MNSRLVDLPDGEGIPKGPVEAWLLCDELICGKLPCVRSLNFREAEVGAASYQLKSLSPFFIIFSAWRRRFSSFLFIY